MNEVDKMKQKFGVGEGVQVGHDIIKVFNLCTIQCKFNINNPKIHDFITTVL